MKVLLYQHYFLKYNSFDYHISLFYTILLTEDNTLSFSSLVKVFCGQRMNNTEDYAIENKEKYFCVLIWALNIKKGNDFIFYLKFVFVWIINYIELSFKILVRIIFSL